MIQDQFTQNSAFKKRDSSFGTIYLLFHSWNSHSLSFEDRFNNFHFRFTGFLDFVFYEPVNLDLYIFSFIVLSHVKLYLD